MQPTKQQIQQWAKGSTLTRDEVDQHTVHETQSETRKTSEQTAGDTSHSCPAICSAFRCIVADPPWDVMRGPEYNSNGPSKPLPYPTMSIAQIAALPVKSMADKHAHLYIWTINKYIEQTYAIARAWGFSPSALLTWAKNPHGIGIGGTYVQTTEHILFCRRGTCKAFRRVDSTWWNWKRGKHSAKPEEFQKMVESVSPGPYLELFARRKRHGWASWGNEIANDVEMPNDQDQRRQ